MQDFVFIAALVWIGIVLLGLIYTYYQRHGVLQFIFRWYDAWVGFYFDRENRTLYVFLVPMLGLRIQLPKRPKFHHRLH